MSEIDRFKISKFLIDLDFDIYLIITLLYLAFLRLGRNMTAPITNRFSRVPTENISTSYAKAGVSLSQLAVIPW